MDYLQALVLAAVEGITEFLPISSTGHLILTTKLLNIPQTNFVKSFEISIQLGAIFSIVFLYWKTFLNSRKILRVIAVGFTPTLIIGFFLYPFIKNTLLGSSQVTLAALFFGGIALIALELVHKEKTHHIDSVEKISDKQAFVIGFAQSIAVVPGVSRSAATIIGALFMGTKRKTAVEFSFFLAVPTMLAATALDLFENGLLFTTYEYSFLIVGFVGSFLFAIIAVKYFLKYIQSHTFIPFGIYRIILVIIFLSLGIT